MNQSETPRRDFIKTAGTAALTSSLFTGKLKGANDKLSLAYIGVGRMGQSNLHFGGKQENVAVSAICDVFEPNLENAISLAKKMGHSPRAVRDFREVLADKSIDVVCIATPDNWHAYMMVEACKAGKDVYVEKPISVTIEEGQKMVQAARKYNRVVQAGTMQRSGIHFQKATEIVRSGELGQVAFVRTWNYSHMPPEGIGNPPDSAPPSTLNWDMWLGPAPERPYNANRFGIDQEQLNRQRWFANFRWFWDYAGGMMTDWGVHWLDIVQMAFNEEMPKSIVSVGQKLYLKDNRETPDTLQVTYEYPNFIAVYENRSNNQESMFQKNGGILFHGDKGTLYVDRSGYQVVPEGRNSPLKAEEVKSSNQMNDAHWQNFLQCVRSRQRPISDIEKCYRSTATCLLGNVALRSRLRVDWDEKTNTVAQAEARKYLKREERAPWKIVV